MRIRLVLILILILAMTALAAIATVASVASVAAIGGWPPAANVFMQPSPGSRALSHSKEPRSGHIVPPAGNVARPAALEPRVTDPGVGENFSFSPGRATQEQRLAPGGHVIIRNPSGPVSITGWDRDIIQAIAEGDDDRRSPSVKISEDPSRHAVVVISPDMLSRRHGGEVHLIIKLPHNAHIDSVHTGNGEIEVTGIDGAVTVFSGGGDLKIEKVGPLSANTGGGGITIQKVSGDATITTGGGDIEVEGVEGKASITTGGGNVTANRIGSLGVRTSGGDVSAENINGSATIQTNGGSLTAKNIKGDLVARGSSGDIVVETVGGIVNLQISSGDVKVHNAQQDVKVNSLSGDIEIACVKGNVETGSADGTIKLEGIAGDIDARTTSGEVRFSGILRSGGRYRLKSTSGEVSMKLPPDSPGFTATLSSYTGEIETDFPLRLESPLQQGPVNRRVIGRYGDGRTQITLDSFSGTVTLSKGAVNSTKKCK